MVVVVVDSGEREVFDWRERRRERRRRVEGGRVGGGIEGMEVRGGINAEWVLNREILQ